MLALSLGYCSVVYYNKCNNENGVDDGRNDADVDSGVELAGAQNLLLELLSHVDLKFCRNLHESKRVTVGDGNS